MWFLVFGGEPRGYRDVGFDPRNHAHDLGEHDANPARKARESSWWLLGPMAALAAPAIAVGWPWTIIPLPGFSSVIERLLEFGEPAAATDLGSAHLFAGAASLLVVAIGIGLGVLYYAPWSKWKRLDASKTAARYAPIHNFLVHRWYLDELYRVALVRPTLALSRWVAMFDRRVLDGVVDGLARLAAGGGRVVGGFDRRIVDGLVSAFAAAVDTLGRWGRAVQTGRLRQYLMVLALATIGLFAGMFAWVMK
jgi:NADH:ubiquinone oxidoreductase subunit 5 (subunit L)/multisubunit Na+/H+ antiporter MnhA subunit